MLPLESFLQLLKELREETVARSENPPNRDAFELGFIAGMANARKWIDDRIRELIQQQQGNEDDE